MEKDFLINLKVGNDNGNSEQDIIIEGEQICQPNVCAKTRKLPLLDEVHSGDIIKNIHDNLLVTIDSPTATPGIYYVGNYALNSGQRVKNIEVGIDNNKIESEIVVINTLAHIAAFAAKKAYLEDKNIRNINVIVDMATALPISQYNKQAAKSFAAKFLNDSQHKVTVHVGPTRINVEIKFDFVKVIPEGVTATWALQAKNEIYEEHNNNTNENLNKDYFKNKNMLHIAIGEGTTEFPITKGIVFDPNFIKGSNNGIGIAIDKALDEFKEELGLIHYSRQKYSEVLRDKGHKYYEIASDIVYDYVEEQANEILHHAKNEIQRANNEIDIIVVYGGGSILMREHLETKLKQYCERAKIKLLYIPKNYAVTLESEGLYEFALSDIFKILKEKSKNVK